MISICTTVKNRSRVDAAGHRLELFPNCVRSIVHAMGNDIPGELVVADWHSTDWPLDQWLPKAAGQLPLNILSLGGGFSRGKGLNVAAEAARGHVLFFLDADALVCRELFADGQRHVAQGKAYFPVLFSFRDAQNQTGWWRHEGYGHAMLTRDLFQRAGGWPEYGKWGKEDNDFFVTVSQLAEIVREEVPGFYHQWHPNDVLWKNHHSDQLPAIVEEQRLSDTLRQELMAGVPAGETVILVDEGRFDSDWLPDRTTLPFLERDGVYWGPPATDSDALAELERQRGHGAGYLAVAWPAFWWLEHYVGLHRHLRDRYRCLVENDRLVVFDLRLPPQPSNSQSI